MTGMQHSYRAEKNRATRLLTPSADETLIRNEAEAHALLKQIDETLARKQSGQRRAELLLARASIFQALGLPEMLEETQKTAKEVRTAQAAALLAVAYHFHGRLYESVQYHQIAYKRPHEPGWEIDVNYENSLLMKGEWQKAWKIALGLKKRFVYSAYLKTWTGQPVPKLSILPEGGFGDSFQAMRYFPRLNSPATLYLPPYFFEHGFVDLARRQPWMLPIKPLLECPQDAPAAGIFDLPAIFNTLPCSIPPSPKWVADPERVEWFRNQLQRTEFPRIGFCWDAREMETPLMPKGVYRSLTATQADRIKSSLGESFVDLQHGSNPDLKSWEDNAALIENLDAVITVDTANMHLAASMGKPTWVLLSGASDWKFGFTGDTMPWYPTLKIFRNNAFGFDNAVSSVIEAITSGALKSL